MPTLPPRSPLSSSSAASDVYKRQVKLSLLCALASAVPPSVYPVDEYIYNSTIDWYNFLPAAPGISTFPLRYYVNQQHWLPNSSAPVLFYTGNEADIFQFVNNSGFMFELAQELNAMVVFAEHRYYGLSNPFGDDYALGVPRNVSFLTVEQAMQDFNTLTVHIRSKWALPDEAAFIAFGGSYGGNLAMWLRLKNPNLWAGAIASSATPLKHLLRDTNDFAKIETEAYGNVSSKCPELVRQGWADLFGNASSAAGRELIGQELGLCAPLSEGGAGGIAGWVEGALETMVQYGYPYPTSFYNPVPAFPFKVSCEGMLRANTGLGALRAAASVYYNHTGQAGPCFNQDDASKQASQHWIRLGQQHRVREFSESQRGWGYQCCNEVYQPMPTNGISDFLLPSTPNKTEYFANCLESWGVVPRPDWEEMTFMGEHISAGSNLFPVSYTHLRAHETVLDLVCRLLLEKKKKNKQRTLFDKII
eukprot:TRINITY_DN52568_c0_g1_i1.p1 TRINITY_DN52568_c0_g1~~TRINITY_DN52568_c0_g1_i1.p1  ORF type:complete len:476 (-),score=81.05 TRINITY_DN52568_c0_g1_i1:1-1428(-)